MKISTKKRKIGYTHNSISGYFSLPRKKSINFESKLEKDFLTMISFSEHVLNIIEQPFTIEYEYEGKLRKYTPDFLVYFKPSGSGTPPIFHHKPLLVEVKRKEEITKKFYELKPKFKAAIKYSAQENYLFKLYDEERIYGTYFENIEFLRRYRRNQYDIHEQDKIIDYLSMFGESTIRSLLNHLYDNQDDKNITFGHICQLLERKILSTDFQKPIQKDSLIWDFHKNKRQEHE